MKMSVHMFCVAWSMLNGLLIPLAIPYLSGCSPSRENTSLFDIQKEASSYDIEATWICVDEGNQQRFACSQQAIRASGDKEIVYSYTNVGLARIPGGATMETIRIDGMVVARDRSSSFMEPGRELRVSFTPSYFSRVDKGPGTYEMILRLRFSKRFGEASTDNNVFVQMVKVRE